MMVDMLSTLYYEGKYSRGERSVPPRSKGGNNILGSRWEHKAPEFDVQRQKQKIQLSIIAVLHLLKSSLSLILGCNIASHTKIMHLPYRATI